MGKRQSMTKSGSGDGFMPMTSADGCRWAVKGGLPMVMKKGAGVAD